MSTTHRDYMAKVQLQLDTLNARMDVLRAAARHAGVASRHPCDRQMSKLRHQSNFAAANLAEIAAAGEQDWDERVAEVERLRDDGNRSVLLPRDAPLASRQGLDTAVQALAFACAALSAGSRLGHFDVTSLFRDRACGTAQRQRHDPGRRRETPDQAWSRSASRRRA